MKQPTFYLDPCPRCSSRVAIDRPLWREAGASSRVRGVDCFILAGCVHVVKFDQSRIRERGELEKIESAWSAEAARMFAEMTATWTEHQVSEFRRVLIGKIHALPGATDEITFTPDPPAQ